MAQRNSVARIKEAAAKLNLVTVAVQEGKHYKVFFDTPAGKKILVVSRTTSCARAEQNNISILRKWSKGVA